MEVIFKFKKISGVPLIECYIPGVTYRGIIFVNHGYTSKKETETSYCLELAKKNYFVIAIDAYKHGERIQEPYISGSEIEKFEDFFNVIIQTGNDIKKIYNDNYKERFDMINLLGISMGGAVSYYTATIMENINAVIPIIGSPSFYEFSKFKIDRMDKSDDDIRGMSLKIEELKIVDPINRPELFLNKKMFILNGNEDSIVPEKWSKRLYEKIIKLAEERKIKTNIKFKSYKVGHNVTIDMKKELYDWCEKNI
ncbi:MAG: alpha/beta hydrolase [Clostridiales bacterium]